MDSGATHWTEDGAPINEEVGQPLHTTEDAKTEEAPEKLVNMSEWFKIICWSGFLAYFFAAIGSFGHFMSNSTGSGKNQTKQKLLTLEYWSRILVLANFVSCHVIRFCFPGKVCAGDFMAANGITDGTGYLVATGDWLVTYIVIAWVAVPTFLLLMILFGGKDNAAFVLNTPK